MKKNNRSNVLSFRSADNRQTTARRAATAVPSAKSGDCELLDVHALVTKGKDGIMAYTVTGYSGVAEIKKGYIVFVDLHTKPSEEDITLHILNGKYYVHRFMEKGLLIVGHLAVYSKAEVRNGQIA